MTPDERKEVKEILKEFKGIRIGLFGLGIIGIIMWVFTMIIVLSSCTSTNPKTIEKERYEKKYYTPKEL